MRVASRAPIVPVALIGALLLGGAEVHAEDRLPNGEWGVVGALRSNSGDVGEAYSWGWLLGFAAGYQLSDYPFGVSWSMLWGRFTAKDAALVNDTLSVVEMSLGLSARKGIGRLPQFVFVSGGATLFRASVALPPEQERIFVGPYAGGGYEFYLTNDYCLNLEGRYGLIAGGPAGLTILLSLNFGTGGSD